MAEQAEMPAVAPASKGAALGMAVNAAGVFVLSLAAVVAGGFVNAKLHPVQELVVGDDGQLTLKPEKEHAAEGGPPASGPAVYYAFDPPFVVNFEQDGAMRFLQITVEVMARDPEVISAVRLNAPLIRNNVMLQMSSLGYDDIMSREAKEKLRGAALEEVRTIVKRESGKSGVEDLLFTSFVVQ